MVVEMGGYWADSTWSGDNMVPTKTGTNDGEENSHRSRSAKTLSLRWKGAH